MPNLIPDVVLPGTMTARQQPLLRAQPSLVLRPWQDSDVPAVVTAYADPEIQRWHLQSKDEAEATEWVSQWKLLWQQETDAAWAITDEASGTLLGRMGLRQIELERGRAEAAYWILPAARGRGVASSALRALTTWAFDELGLHRLDLLHSARNPGSCRVAVKNGFDLEGVARDFALHDDGWHDYHLHGRVALDHQVS